MNQVSVIQCVLEKNESSKELLATKILETLIFLRDLDFDYFGNWFELGYSRKKALEKKVDFSYDYLFNQVVKNWDKKFPDLGTSVWFWSGKADTQNTSISFRVGLTSINPFLNPIIVIEFPFEHSLRVDENDDRIIAITKKMTEIWSPKEINFLRYDR